MNKRPIAVASLLAAVTLLPHPGAAQTYPARPVKIVVPAQPGGGLDLIGRTLAAELGRSLGQSFVVENVAGAGGSIPPGAPGRWRRRRPPPAAVCAGRWQTTPPAPLPADALATP